MASRVHVDSCEHHHPEPENVVAFGIDQPQTYERFRDAGFEFNGWVMGRDTIARGVHTTVRGRNSDPGSLDMRSPDVGAAP